MIEEVLLVLPALLKPTVGVVKDMYIALEAENRVLTMPGSVASASTQHRGVGRVPH
jgi:hypothetical protein